MGGVEVVNYGVIGISFSEAVSVEEIDLIGFWLFSAGSHYPVVFFGFLKCFVLFV